MEVDESGLQPNELASMVKNMSSIFMSMEKEEETRTVLEVSKDQG